MSGVAAPLLRQVMVLLVLMAQLELLLSRMQSVFHLLVQFLKLVPVAQLVLSGVLFKTSVPDDQ